MVKLNENKTERRLGIIFMIIWLLIFLFYLTWDGWLYEWQVCGYAGPNQHFSFDFWHNMIYYLSSNGTIVYVSTNNLHNIIYLCYFQFFLGWLGLLTGVERIKQGTMVLLAFPVSAVAATLFPLHNHLYIVQIVYDTLHICGIIIGAYLFYKNDLNLKKATPTIFVTWGIYILSRILLTPWPYWDHKGQAYFSLNQINNMPFYFYGLEYVIVVILLYAINLLIKFVNSKFKSRKWHVIFPMAFFVGLCILFLALGLVQVTTIDMGTCSSTSWLEIVPNFLN